MLAQLYGRGTSKKKEKTESCDVFHWDLIVRSWPFISWKFELLSALKFAFRTLRLPPDPCGTEPVRNFVFVSHTSILDQEVAYGEETTNHRSGVIG